MQKRVLITGANRGIGLEFARQYAAEGWRVHACCRQPEAAAALRELDGTGVQLHRLDLTSPGAIDALAQALRSEPLDLLLNNAGTYGAGASQFGQLQEQAWLETLHINTLAPLLMAQAFLPHLEAGTGRTIATLTSRMGSIGDNSSGGSYAYRSSKAALNAALASLAIDLAPREIKVLLFHPGWVRTDMGGPSATLEPASSAQRLRTLITGATPDDSGRFIDIDGSTIAW